MPPKGSSYMIFSTELRASVKESLQAEGKPCAMGDVAKALGARWRELSADEKKVYTERASSAKASALAAAEAAGEEGGAEGAGRVAGRNSAQAPSHSRRRGRETEAEEASPASLPLARVKRIIRQDPEVKQVSAEAARLVGLATELFLQSLTAGTHAVTAGSKRKTVRFADVEQHVMRRGKLWFLHDHVQAMKDTSRPKEAKPRAAAAGEAPAAGARGIASFFSPAAGAEGGGVVAPAEGAGEGGAAKGNGKEEEEEEEEEEEHAVEEEDEEEE